MQLLGKKEFEILQKTWRLDIFRLVSNWGKDIGENANGIKKEDPKEESNIEMETLTPALSWILRRTVVNSIEFRWLERGVAKPHRSERPTCVPRREQNGPGRIIPTFTGIGTMEKFRAC
ncbi:hypothetical protein AVEN_47468-1 [Araneus ventricosus]|uniref:Uncharacterized protein n=1 Tax=Araneus ventricosus TaxID=182803 RepID=A0A4Y2UBS3_ARAVE|nr:hypothetical protein AVEN_47468-1 [Araneus ventricosus]